MTPDELVETWRQLAQQQFHRAGFDEVVDQRLQLDITFSVYLVATRDGVLAPWIPRVEALLRQCGFQVVVQDEVTADALLALRREAPDILLVWCTTTDLQALCTALAADRSAKSHLLVCVPEGDDGMLYCRLLREHHGIETVSLPVQRLQAGQECRFGLDVLKRCADYLLERIAVTRREARIKNTYVLLVHGIRTRALWQGPVRATFERAGLVAWPTNYSKLDVVRFILPFEGLKRRAIARVKKELTDLKANAPTAEVVAVAHSFGSYIVGDLLRKGESFRTIAFSGSVLPGSFDFSTTRRALIVNEVGCSDVWPVLAEKLGWAYGATGTFGFNSGSVIDRIHASCGHSTSLTSDFCSKFWVPLFCDEHVESTGEDNAQPSWIVRLLDSIPLFGTLFWLLAICVICTVTYLLLTALGRLAADVLSRLL